MALEYYSYSKNRREFLNAGRGQGITIIKSGDEQVNLLFCVPMEEDAGTYIYGAQGVEQEVLTKAGPEPLNIAKRIEDKAVHIGNIANGNTLTICLDPPDKNDINVIVRVGPPQNAEMN